MRYSPSSSQNYLYYGDNLEVLRKYIPDESVDLCYIDPPFNSKRNYNQLYNNIGKEDVAQAQAFVDTWIWNERADWGFAEITDNYGGLLSSQTIKLITGLRSVLGEGSLLAYLVSMTLRIVEIHRVLKPTGSFYLHCDPTSSHYLKLVLDSIFCSQGGDFQNEIIWCYRGGGSPKKAFGRRHDVIFRYSKGKEFIFNADPVRIPYQAEGFNRKDDAMWGKHKGTDKVYKPNPLGKIPEDWWLINPLNANDPERLGYPTQKPKALLARIIQASSNEGDVVLDAYCGCGTTVAAAQELNRRWVGIDITYQSISLVLQRLEGEQGVAALDNVVRAGIPQDLASAEALANKQDDRVRKEFEKWAVLTYSNNRASRNEKKGADRGVDGTAFFLKAGSGHGRLIFQVKSGKVGAKDIRGLAGTMTREKADLAVFITLKKPTSEMLKEAASYKSYHHELMGRSYPTIQIVTIEEMLKGARLDMPLSLEVVRSAQRVKDDPGQQIEIFPIEATG